MPAADLGAEAGRPLEQNGLGPRLRNATDAEIAALDDAIVDGQSTEMPEGYRLELTEFLEKSALTELLDGAGGKPERPGLLHRFRQAVEYDHRPSGQAEFTGEHESGRAAPATITSA